MNYLGHIDKLRRVCPAKVVKGRKEDEGYRFLGSAGISFQGMSANNVGNAIVALACNLETELEITFIWRTRKGALYPGETARLRLSGKPVAI